MICYLPDTIEEMCDIGCVCDLVDWVRALGGLEDVLHILVALCLDEYFLTTFPLCCCISIFCSFIKNK